MPIMARRPCRSPDLFQPDTLDRIQLGADVDAPTYIAARRQIEELRRRASSIFDGVDLLVTPTTVVPPFETSMAHTQEELRALELVTLRNTRPFNALGLPAVSVPCGFTSGGLPIGLQITGPPGGEAGVLALGHAYQQCTDWHRTVAVGDRDRALRNALISSQPRGLIKLSQTGG